MSTVTEGKDTIKFVDEEQINQAAADAAASTPNEANEAKEEKEDAASAFNPETGEINWDCPCKLYGVNGLSQVDSHRDRFGRYGTRPMWRGV